jgi:predicted dienelactone hydrolase
MIHAAFTRSCQLLITLALCIAARPAALAQSASAPASAPAGATPITTRWQAPKGPFLVATIDLHTFRDEARAKDLECTIRFPILSKADHAQPASFPLVIFSHGMGGSRTAFADLSEFWASHGYIVIHPTHADSVELQKRTNPDAARGFLTNPRDYTNKVDPAGRLADAKFLLDNLSAIEAVDPRLRTGDRGLINRDKIAMAGHSAGAMTTQLAIGAHVRGARGLSQGESLRQRMQVRSVGDDRIDVGLIISGQGTTSRMFTDESWLKVPVPTLTITGSNDTSRASDETPQSRRHPFEKSPGRAKGGQPAYLLWLEGATHGSYQGKGLTKLLGEGDVPHLDTIVRATKVVTLAMLDAYLKDDQQARALLEDAAAAKKSTQDVATLDHK